MMMGQKIKATLCVVAVSSLFFTSTVFAEYGCGTYGANGYGSDCPAQTQTTPTTTQPDTTTTPEAPTVTANGVELVSESSDAGSTAPVTNPSSIPTFIVTKPIVFSGVTKPYAEVHLYFHSTPFEAIVYADKNGYWSYTLPVEKLEEGSHTIQIAVRDPDTKVLSALSKPKIFKIIDSAAHEASEETKPTTNNPDYTQAYIAAASAVVVLAVIIWWLAAAKRKKK